MRHMSRISRKRHWERIYEGAEEEKLSWYEEVPTLSLDLAGQCELDQNSRILIAGAGTSRLADFLLERGFTDIIATDISSQALALLKRRLGSPAAGKVTFVADDLLQPKLLPGFSPVQLWHDRAVLHFFIDEEDRQAYFDLLRQMLAPGGYALLAAFNLQSVKMCSGLPVMNYNAEMLSEALGDEFELLSSFDYTHHTPSGEPRPYVYGLWRKAFQRMA